MTRSDVGEFRSLACNVSSGFYKKLSGSFVLVFRHGALFHKSGWKRISGPVTRSPSEFAFLGVRTEKGMHVEESGIRKCQTLLVKRQIKNPTLLTL